MENRRKTFAIVTAVIVAVGAVGYEVLTSSAPSSPCASSSSSETNASVARPALAPGETASTARIGLPVGSGAGASAPSARAAGSRGSGPSSGVVQVVAAENFWGSLVSQLGGTNASVLSIVTNPNTDPHEYEANSSDAIAIADAQFVIVNGVGYDDWALQLIAAAKNPDQIVLNVGDLNGVGVTGGIVTGNPHLWYNPVYVNRTVAAMFADLVLVQPSSRSYFQANYAALNASLSQLYAQANQIKTLFAGTEVASTESIFVYLANYTGLDLVSPPAFMEAIAEGNDPPAQSVVEFQCQLESGHVVMLVYNEQTVTPITDQMKAIAAENNVSVVGITETIQPPNEVFQFWMGAEYQALENALNSKVLGQ
jgi:zinc/manganese transport system substrate-binding protein